MTLRVSFLFHVSALALFPTNALHLILDRKVALLFRRLNNSALHASFLEVGE